MPCSLARPIVLACSFFHLGPRRPRQSAQNPDAVGVPAVVVGQNPFRPYEAKEKTANVVRRATLCRADRARSEMAGTERRALQRQKWSLGKGRSRRIGELVESLAHRRWHRRQSPRGERGGERNENRWFERRRRIRASQLGRNDVIGANPKRNVRLVNVAPKVKVEHGRLALK